MIKKGVINFSRNIICLLSIFFMMNCYMAFSTANQEYSITITKSMQYSTRASQILNIEVDFYQANQYEISDSFILAKQWISKRNIVLAYNFNSTHNEITYVPGIDDTMVRFASIEFQYHDSPATSIYCVISRGNALSNEAAETKWSGITINLDYYDTIDNRTEYLAFVILHEIGHCIGAGLHDNIIGGEVYSSKGFMAAYPNELCDYSDDDWNDTLAPITNNATYSQASIFFRARLNNKISVVGELGEKRGLVIVSIINDDGALIMGRAYFEDINEETSTASDHLGKLYILVPEGSQQITYTVYNDTTHQIRAQWKSVIDVPSRQILNITGNIPNKVFKWDGLIIVILVVIVLLVLLFLCIRKFSDKWK
jgi:hypothetical protein